MNRRFSKRWIFALLMLFPALMYHHSLMAQDTATEEPDMTTEATSEPIEMTFGSGPFNLLSPTVGLSSLSSYRATLTLSFEGTNAGQAEQWSRTYTMLVTQTPSSRQLLIDTVNGDQVYMAEIDNNFYERRDGSCIAAAVTAEGAFAERWEPAGLLDSVIGAQEAGSEAEAVNGIAADHYTFDESTQGASGIADSTGDLWVASDGGYLVRYMLTTTGSDDYFGEGVEGILTWDYALTEVNQRLVIDLPEDCPAALLDVPVIADATDVFQMPGHTSYRTASALDEVVAFYEELIAASGGQADHPPLISENNVMFGFTHGDQPILLIVSNDGGSTNVELLRLGDPAELVIVSEVPDERGENAVSENTPDDCSGESSAILMLPDASNVQNMMGVITYNTNLSIADAVAFYEEHVTAQGGQVSSPMPASDMMAILSVQQDDQMLSISISSMGGINSVLIASMTGSPLSLTSNCG